MLKILYKGGNNLDRQFRIGIGYDIHRLIENRKLIIGGIEIPYAKGLMGHSDADVLLHAICDCLLGAIAKGDIGEHFPDTDPAYKNISSLELLKRVNNLVKENKYAVANLDTVIIAEEPKLTPFKELMRKKIASVLNINIDQIAIKAKTNERIGFSSGTEVIAAYASVLLAKE